MPINSDAETFIYWDDVYHQDGTVEVELCNAASPRGSLKAMNPPSAAYTPGSAPTSYVKGTYAFVQMHFLLVPMYDALAGGSIPGSDGIMVIEQGVPVTVTVNGTTTVSLTNCD